MTSNATAASQAPRPNSWTTRFAPILLPALALVLTSCAHGTRATPEIPAELLALVDPIPPIGEDLTTPCPAQLPPAVDNSLGGLGRNHLVSAAIYHDCKDRQKRLSAAARDREKLELARIERARQALERSR